MFCTLMERSIPADLVGVAQLQLQLLECNKCKKNTLSPAGANTLLDSCYISVLANAKPNLSPISEPQVIGKIWPEVCTAKHSMALSKEIAE